jgi:hypothetical protein
MWNEVNFDVLYTNIVTLDSLHFFKNNFVDYKCKLPQVTINHIQNVKISFTP